MSWQEELRRIDGDLAAGKLSKEEYAVRREELLAQASSTPAPSREPEPKVTATSALPMPAKDLLTTNRQTTAPSPADDRSTDSMPHPPQRPQQRAPEPVRPAEVPPPVPQQTRREPALFEPKTPDPFTPPPDHTRGGRRAAAFLAVGVLVALALIGGGLWWLTSGGENRPQAAPPAEPTAGVDSPPSTGPSELVDELPQLPGVLNRNSGTFAPDEGADRKLYGKDEAMLLKRQGVREVTWKGSSRTAGDAAMAYVVLVAENESAAEASSTAKALRQLSGSRVPKASGLAGYEELPTFRGLSDKTNVYRVIYTSGRKTVRVGVVQTPGIDAKRLTRELSDLLGQLTATLPPRER